MFVFRPQVDLWTETLASEEYDALAMMIAQGVTTEVEIAEAPHGSTDSPSGGEGGEEVGEGGEGGEGTAELAGGKALCSTRYCTIHTEDGP